MIFLFGAGFGAGITMLYLHKMIKDELDNLQIQGDTRASEVSVEGSEGSSEGGSEGDVPFKMKDDKDSNNDEKRPQALKQETKIAYNKLIDSVEKGEKPSAGIPVREPVTDENGGYFVDETDGGIYEIDKEEFLNDKSYEQDRLIYYQDDRIMATEDGTIITNPAMLVGGEWERCVGNYADKTAFIRNPRLATDYEIYVEEGAYQDEYGPLSDD